MAWRRTDNTMAKRKRTNNDLQYTAQKTKDRATRTPLKTGDKLRCSRRISSFCSTCGTRRVTLVTHPLIRHGWGKDRVVNTTNGTYPWSFVTHGHLWHRYSLVNFENNRVAYDPEVPDKTSYIGHSAFAVPTTFRFFWLSNLLFLAYLVKVIPETRRTYFIRYLYT